MLFMTFRFAMPQSTVFISINGINNGTDNGPAYEKFQRMDRKVCKDKRAEDKA